jgi:predicted nucleic acid-binding protein
VTARVPTQGLLDTSVLVASESGRALDLDRLPDRSAVSVVTVGELHAGVLAARDVETRARRLATLDLLADISVVSIDEDVAVAWARLRALLAEAGRRVNVNDTWIAATAVTYHLPVVTQDDDYDAMADLGVTVIRV